MGNNSKSSPASRKGAATIEAQLGVLKDVPLKLVVEMGRTRLSIQELLRLAPGSMVELDRLAGEPLDITVNGKLVARGEAIVVNGRLGVRVTEVLAAATSPMKLDESA